MGKISKRKKQIFIRTIVFVVIIQIVLLVFLAFLLVNTTNATTENTSVLDVEILDVIVSDGSNKLTTVYLKTPVGYYRTDWKTYDKEIYNPINNKELEKSLTEEPLITLTVLNNSKKSSILYGDTMSVVDIRSDSAVYYDIANYNQWQKENRFVLFVAFSMVEIVLIIVSIFQLYLNNPFYNKKTKKK